jgi:methionyl-tRNA synthetase
VCGSDEYGTATETQAIAEGTDPATLCAKYHAIHRDIYKWFRVDFDIFGRTPTPEHTQITQEIFTSLWKNGFIEERETAQAYCPAHNSFLADRFVEGECSLCHDLGARGDQCDKCGNLLDPLEPDRTNATEEEAETKATGWLINPHCKLDGATPERRKTKHLYLRLDALQKEIVSWLENGASKEWAANAIAITQSWIENGLKPRSITRDLKWGVPVPQGLEGLSDEEFKNKVFYVWFDACIGYPSITKCYTDGGNPEGRDWEKWWKNPNEVSLYQFMGKDNVPFHSIIFPASQLGTRESWTQVHKLSTTEYLNYEGGKFSKSKNVGVFGNRAQDTGIPPDVWRYYLLSRRPESSDSEFKWDDFIDSNNNDLLKNLGNLCQRVVKFAQAKLDGVVPDYTKYVDESGSLEANKAEINALLTTYITDLKATKLRAGLSTILAYVLHTLPSLTNTNITQHLRRGQQAPARQQAQQPTHKRRTRPLRRRRRPSPQPPAPPSQHPLPLHARDIRVHAHPTRPPALLRGSQIRHPHSRRLDSRQPQVRPEARRAHPPLLRHPAVQAR